MKILTLGSSLAFCLMVAAPMTLRAEETVRVSYVKQNFDSKINSWVEGTIMTIDADGGRLIVRGTKRAYASAYAEMLREIDTKTDGLTDAEFRAKEQEIRQKWAAPLKEAREKPATAEGNFTFYLPEKGKTLKVANESSNYDLLTLPTLPPVNVKTTEREQAAILAFKDLKVSERVVVGYESGVIYNNAYVVIRTAANNLDIAQDAKGPGPVQTGGTVDVPAGRKTDAKIDNETLASIRRSIVDNKNLSTKAHNITLVRENEMLTLKGAVESIAEKTILEAKAAEFVGADRVVNQLVVENK